MLLKCDILQLLCWTWSVLSGAVWKFILKTSGFCLSWRATDRVCYAVWSQDWDSFKALQFHWVWWVRFIMLHVTVVWLSSLTVICRTCNAEVTQRRSQTHRYTVG